MLRHLSYPTCEYESQKPGQARLARPVSKWSERSGKQFEKTAIDEECEPSKERNHRGRITETTFLGGTLR